MRITCPNCESRLTQPDDHRYTAHGPMWELAESPTSIALLEAFYNSGKPIALVCHSPGVLRHVTYQGAPLVKGKHVTGFTNGEEELMQLTKVVPFLVEDGDLYFNH